MLRSAAHETYHFVEGYSKKDADDLRDYVIDALKGNGVDIEKALEKYAKQGYATRDEQISELVADSMFDVFSNEDFIKDLTAKNQTLAKRLANHIGELVQKIREAVKMLSVRYSNPEIKALMDDAEKLDTIRNMLLEGYKNAGENFKAEQAKGQKNNAEDSAVKYSKKYNNFNNNEDIINLISKVKSGQYKNNERVELGIVSDKAAKEIEKILGIDVSDFKVAIEARQIFHILNDHGAKGKADHSMANDADIAKIEYVLNEFDDISFSGKTQAYSYMKDGFNRTAETVLYEKDIGSKSYYVVQAVPNSKKKTLYIVSAFIGIHGYKNGASQLINTSNGPNATAKTGSVVTPINSIPKTIKSVKQNLSEIDAEYLEAVKNGDNEASQRMVDKAAKAAGYNSPVLYHGTQSFGFTEFDLSRMDDKRTIFLTSNNKIASTYSGVTGTRKVSSSYSKDIDGMKLEKVTDELNALSDEYYKGALDYRKYTYIDTEYSNELISTVNDGIDALQKNVSSMLNRYKDDGKIYMQLFGLNEKLKRYEYHNLSTPIYMLLHHTEVFAENGKEIAELEKNIRLLNEIRFLDISEGYVVREMLDGYSLDLLDETEARDELKYLSSKGNYSMYAKSDNPLVIDGKGQLWRDIRHWASALELKKEDTRVERRNDEYYLVNQNNEDFIEEGSVAVNSFTEEMPKERLHTFMLNKANQMLRIQTEGIYTTREIARFAKERGYDSVIFKNILDNGGMNSDVEMSEAADIYVYFSPNQLKSADPVTYDNNGDVIPLSERFKESNVDIRYSMKQNKNKKQNEFSYDKLIKKPDMKVTELTGTVPKFSDGKINRADLIELAHQNAIKAGRKNEQGNAVIRVADIDRDVIVSKAALRHGIDRRAERQAPALMNIGEILENSIKINELFPKKSNAVDSYILLGVARDENDSYIFVNSIVNTFTGELEDFDVLYSIDAKKESAASVEARASDNALSLTDSTISISNLFDIVKDYFPNILPQSVLDRYNLSRGNSEIERGLIYSRKQTDPIQAHYLHKIFVHQTQNMTQLICPSTLILMVIFHLSKKCH